MTADNQLPAGCSIVWWLMSHSVTGGAKVRMESQTQIPLDWIKPVGQESILT